MGEVEDRRTRDWRRRSENKGLDAYSTATCSGRVERSGNVPSMSVNTLDSGCDIRPRVGWSRDTTLG